MYDWIVIHFWRNKLYSYSYFHCQMVFKLRVEISTFTFRLYCVCLLPNFRLITVNKEVIVINNFIVGSSIICGSWNDKHRETFKWKKDIPFQLLKHQVEINRTFFFIDLMNSFQKLSINTSSKKPIRLTILKLVKPLNLN